MCVTNNCTDGYHPAAPRRRRALWFVNTENEAKKYQPDCSSNWQSSASLIKHSLATVRVMLWKTVEVTGIKQQQETEKRGSAKTGLSDNLCAGRPHCTPRNLDVKATLGIFFSSKGRVIMWLPTGLPVTNCFPDCLENAAVRGQYKNRH